jgi:SAM-dependent methyltransferase
MSGGYGNNELIRKLSKNTQLNWLLTLIYPPMPTLNTMRNAEINDVQQRIFLQQNIVLNVGSGDGLGCGYRLWENGEYHKSSVYNVDIIECKGTACVADAHRLPFKTKSVDSIILQAVIEHVQNPNRVIDEAFRVLKPGGHLYLEVPFLQGFHADPHDYQRFTLEGLRVLTKKFSEVGSGVSVGPCCALVWILRDGFSSIFKNNFLYFPVRFVLAWMLSPLRYLDFILRGSRTSYRLACEYYFLCQKPK